MVDDGAFPEEPIGDFWDVLSNAAVAVISPVGFVATKGARLLGVNVDVTGPLAKVLEEAGNLAGEILQNPIVQKALIGALALAASTVVGPAALAAVGPLLASVGAAATAGGTLASLASAPGIAALLDEGQKLVGPEIKRQIEKTGKKVEDVLKGQLLALHADPAQRKVFEASISQAQRKLEDEAKTRQNIIEINEDNATLDRLSAEFVRLARSYWQAGGNAALGGSSRDNIKRQYLDVLRQIEGYRARQYGTIERKNKLVAQLRSSLNAQNEPPNFVDEPPRDLPLFGGGRMPNPAWIAWDMGRKVDEILSNASRPTKPTPVPPARKVGSFVIQAPKASQPTAPSPAPSPAPKPKPTPQPKVESTMAQRYPLSVNPPPPPPRKIVAVVKRPAGVFSAYLHNFRFAAEK